MQLDLCNLYDQVAPCFPPSYNIFDSLFQVWSAYHVWGLVRTLYRAGVYVVTTSFVIHGHPHGSVRLAKGIGLYHRAFRLPPSFPCHGCAVIRSYPLGLHPLVSVPWKHGMFFHGL